MKKPKEQKQKGNKTKFVNYLEIEIDLIEEKTKWRKEYRRSYGITTEFNALQLIDEIDSELEVDLSEINIDG